MEVPTPNAAHFHAQASAYRTLWANARDPQDRDRFMEEGDKAELALIATPISCPADAVIKLATAMEWVQPDASEFVIRMLESVLTHLKSQCATPAPIKARKQPEPELAQVVTTGPEAEIAWSELERRAEAAAEAEAEARHKKVKRKAKSATDSRARARELAAKTLYIAQPSKKVFVDKRKRAVWVDGVLYCSITEACQALHILPSEVLKRAAH